MDKKIGFIGAGNMGGAIIGGIISSGITKEENVLVFDKNTACVENLEGKYGIKGGLDLKTVSESDILFLAVKPSVIYDVIREIREYITDNTVVVSIAAGQSIEKLESAFSKNNLKLVRVMPNTPALVGEGMSAVSLNSEMSKTENQALTNDVIDILKSLGKAEIVPEVLMDAVTGVSGSSPAYVFMFIEAMADAAVLGGMPRNQAYTFAAQSVLGAAKMVLELDAHPAELKDMVCSPSGTTIEAVRVLEEKGMRAAVMDAIAACIDKSKSM